MLQYTWWCNVPHWIDTFPVTFRSLGPAANSSPSNLEIPGTQSCSEHWNERRKHDALTCVYCKILTQPAPPDDGLHLLHHRLAANVQHSYSPCAFPALPSDLLPADVQDEIATTGNHLNHCIWVSNFAPSELWHLFEEVSLSMQDNFFHVRQPPPPVLSVLPSLFLPGHPLLRPHGDSVAHAARLVSGKRFRKPVEKDYSVKYLYVFVRTAQMEKRWFYTSKLIFAIDGN